MKGGKPVVFLSYSRADAPAVDELHRKLERSGFDPWMDRSEIRAGDWRTAIKRGLRRSNYFLACLSRHTETLSEVMAFEVDSALEVQKESLEGEVYLIPVRLEVCETPARLGHLQWIDFFTPGGEERLLEALRSKPGYQRDAGRKWAAAGVLVLLAILAAAWWSTRESYPQAFTDSRPGGRLEAKARDRAMVGITVWKLHVPAPADPPFVRYLAHSSNRAAEPVLYTPARLRPDNSHATDKIMLSVESSRKGYLYVLDRAILADGSLGPPRLILPTVQINGGDHEMASGRPVEVPDRFSWPAYMEVPSDPSVAGVQFLFVVAPATLAEVHLEKEPSPVRDELVQQWQRDWGQGVKTVYQDLRESIATEGEARTLGGGGLLGPADPPPQVVFAASRKPPDAVMVTLELRKGR